MVPHLPLAGCRVIDLTHQVAGPFCTMILADLGADVIKVERPPHGDGARNWPYFGESVFLALNRNKRSIMLDLNQQEHRDVLARLIKSADVVVQNFAPTTAKKLKINYRNVRKLNRNVIYCSISGFGARNRYSVLPAWDAVLQARAGLMSVTGEEDMPPMRVGFSVVDMGAGMWAALSIISALHSRSQGRYIDISLYDTAIMWMSYWIAYYSIYQKIPKRNGSGWPAFSPYQAFKTSDGYIYIAVSNELYWRKLCEALGLDRLVKDKRFDSNERRVEHSNELSELIEQQTIKYRSDELASILRDAEIPSSEVRSVDLVVSDDLLRERSILKTIKTASGIRFIAVRNPLSFSGLAKKSMRAPPTVGQDTYSIMKSLGYTKDEIARVLKCQSQQTFGTISSQ
jgi:crotonobetainyl-CoA:carnitine CoA-transferase CaiB-like acyl-CoA transferase